MFYTIYKITNKLDGKIYIGKHQTKDLGDDYMGSGKWLKSAINKRGLENFTKEILFHFDNEAEMNAKEAELVTAEFVKEDTNYNLCPGGEGGWGYINANGKNLYGMNGKTPGAKDNLARGRETQKRLREDDSEYAKKISEKISNSLKGRPGTFKGKKHTDETKQKISIASSGKTPWNVGLKHSLETKQKISKTLKKQFAPNLSSDIKICIACYRKIEQEKSHIENLYWIDKYHNSDIKSIRKFVKESGYPKSHVTFSRILKKY